jgi:hypothetical protein
MARTPSEVDQGKSSSQNLGTSAVGGGCVEMNSFVWPSFSVFLELFFKFYRFFRVFDRKFSSSADLSYTLHV